MAKSFVEVREVALVPGVDAAEVTAMAEAAVAGMASVSHPNTHPAAYVLGAISAAHACLVALEAPDEWRVQLALCCEQAMRAFAGADLGVQ